MIVGVGHCSGPTAHPGGRGIADARISPEGVPGWFVLEAQCQMQRPPRLNAGIGAYQFGMDLRLGKMRCQQQPK
jgi:hypothetical protein